LLHVMSSTPAHAQASHGGRQRRSILTIVASCD
jgi:hypothetical protein